MELELNILKNEIQRLADKNKAKILQKFFKTDIGQYGEGDVFIGISVPVLRNIAKKHKNIDFQKIEILLKSKIHEYRLMALLILITKFYSNPKNEKKCFDFYLNNLKNINNWDLVDLSAPKILGAFLVNKTKNERLLLYHLADSESMWERRISIVSTLYFIKNNNFKDTLGISKILLGDREDLIHKAVGWMLREVGKRDYNLELEFIKENYKQIPRTTLRYAIERFQADVRQKVLNGIF